MDATRPPRHTDRVSVRDLERLGKALTDLRAELGITQEEFARRADMSLKQLQRIENAKVMNPRPKTLGAIDRGADWEPGSARRILEGGLPAPKRQQRVIPVYNEEERVLAEALAELDYTVDEVIEHLELRRARFRTQSGMDVGQAGENGA